MEFLRMVGLTKEDDTPRDRRDRSLVDVDVGMEPWRGIVNEGVRCDRERGLERDSESDRDNRAPPCC